MATQVEKPVVSDYTPRVEAAKAIHPWPEVFAILEAVPAGGLESMSEADQSQMAWELMKRLAGTRDQPYGLALGGEVAQKLMGTRKGLPHIDWVRMQLGVLGLQVMTPERLAEHARIRGEPEGDIR